MIHNQRKCFRFLFAPVMAGHWKQRELSDGTYSLDDLLDIHEMMAVNAENERRHADALKNGGH